MRYALRLRQGMLIAPHESYRLVFLRLDTYFTGAIKCWYGVSGNIT